MFKWIKSKSLRYLTIEEFKEYGVSAYFTSRRGGISQDSFKSLNLGLHTIDSNDNVLSNRKLISEAIGIDHRNLTAGEQVHGNKVLVVREQDKGKGALKYNNSIKGVDALITDIKDLPLVSFYADCVPLFFLDPVQKVGGLAHAGWKGTVSKIAIKTLDKMTEQFNSSPEQCMIGIGPAISGVNYEVDDNLANKFRETFDFHKEVCEKKKNGIYLLDLPKTNYMMLCKAGVRPENIINSSMCTYDLKEYFYSYRRDNGKTGRMASIFVL